MPFYKEVPDINGIECPTIPTTIILRADNRDRRVGLWLLFAVDIGRQQAVANQRQDVWIIAIKEKADRPRIRLAIDHLVLLKGIDPNPIFDGRSKLTGGDHIGIRPDTVLWVIREVEACGKGVAVVGTSRVACGRDGDAVVEGETWIIQAAGRELGQKPPVHELVVDHNGIA